MEMNGASNRMMTRMHERDSGAKLARYYHGPVIDELLCRVTETNTVYYHHDGLGSTVALTDSTGNVVESYTYDVYGQPSILSTTYHLLPTSSVTNRFLFTGREYLAELALYDHRHRIYSPSLGRFLQTDPLRFDAEDVNLYRYAWNCSPQLIDSFGLKFRYPDQQDRATRKGLDEQISRVRATEAGAAIYNVVDKSETDVYVYPSTSGGGRMGYDDKGNLAVWIPTADTGRPGTAAHEFQHAAEQVTGKKDPANLGVVSSKDPCERTGAEAEPFENRATRVQNIVNDQYYSNVSPLSFHPKPQTEYTTRGGQKWSVPDPYGTKYKAR